MENRLLTQHKCTAAKRGLAWDLTEKEVIDLWCSPCAYCGSSPTNKFSNSGREIVYSGIDRIDSSLGYVSSNVQPCCKRCNIAKNNMTHEEFLAHVAQIYTNWIGTKIEGDLFRSNAAARIGL
jgi:hypothetical protein